MVKENGDPVAPGNETVVDIAKRYGHQGIVDYYEWYGLRSKYSLLLRSLMDHLKKAAPQTDPLFTAEDLAKYRAGCEEKLEISKTAPLRDLSWTELVRAVEEANELRYWARLFLDKTIVVARGTKAKKKK